VRPRRLDRRSRPRRSLLLSGFGVNRVYAVEEYQPIPVGPSGLSATDVDLLEGSWHSITGENPANFFEFGRHAVRTKGWVGTVSIGPLTLAVSPKGSNRLDAADRKRLELNLDRMLELALKAEIPAGISDVTSEGGSRFDRLAEFFCDSVAEARARSRLRKYAIHEESVDRCRGHIMFPQQALLEVRRPGLFQTRWVELTDDRPENRYIKAAARECQIRTSGRVRRRVDELVAQLDQVADVPVRVSDYDELLDSRLTSDYVRALSAGHDILAGQISGIFAGSTEGRSEVLMTSPLFQSFVGTIVRRIAQGRGWRVIPAGQPSQYLAKWEDGPIAGKQCFRLIPDFNVGRTEAGTTVGLFDAKWKQIDLAKPTLGIDEGDLYQVVTYGVRFACSCGVLVYPWLGSRTSLPDVRTLSVVGSSPMRIVIALVPLLWERISDVTSALDSAASHIVPVP
jgi:5-methylcytosine-specific restriction enzyme subunit McrC